MTERDYLTLVPGDMTMLRLWRQHRTGLAPFYPFLYSMVIGMGAQTVFEFGVGDSTEVLLAALRETGGRLYSCSPDSSLSVRDEEPAQWIYYRTTSDVALPQIPEEESFDLCLHDGSHSANVVADDLVAITQRMRGGGLIMVHDSLHSYVGTQVRSGIDQAMHRMPRRKLMEITLPFAFGLTLLQVDRYGADRHAPLSVGADKPTSPHHTEVIPWGWGLR